MPSYRPLQRVGRHSRRGLSVRSRGVAHSLQFRGGRSVGPHAQRRRIKERFCGSHRLFLLDGTPLRHEDCPMADAVRSGTATRNAEVVMERPDGSRFTALVNIRALKDHRGNIQGAINCFQDISAHKAMEQEIQRKSRDLEDFFENGAVGLHIVSGQGIIQRANQAELDLLGLRSEEYVGRHIAEFHVDAPVIGISSRNSPAAKSSIAIRRGCVPRTARSSTCS